MFIEADPNRSNSQVMGEISGEDNLFSMLMEGIIGSENDEEGLITGLSSSLVNEENSDEVSSDASDLLTKLNPKLVVLDQDFKTLTDQGDYVTEIENDLDLSETRFSKFNSELNGINGLENNLEVDESKESEKPSIFDQFLNKIGLKKSVEKAYPQTGSPIGITKKSIENTIDVDMPKSVDKLTVMNGLQKYQKLADSTGENFIKNKIELPIVEMSDVDPTTNELPALKISSFEPKIENQLENKISTNTIDLSSLDLKNVSESDVLGEISNHLDKMKLANAKELQVTVKHNDLGQFQINANEIEQGNLSKLNLEILSNSKDTQNFFKLNESGLTNLLGEKGFTVGSFKISQSSEEFSKDNQFSGEDSRGFSQQQQSRGEGRNQDSQRRAKLWQEYQEKLGA